MTLTHRIQLDPTVKQRIYFAKACGTARLIYNWALAEWREQPESAGLVRHEPAHLVPGPS